MTRASSIRTGTPTWALGALLASCVLLELLCRFLRLPLFPIWIPLLFWGRRELEMKTLAVVLYAGAGTALLYGWWGAAALDFSLAVLIASVSVRVARKWWHGAAFLLPSLLVWLGLSAASSHLLVGALPFDGLLSALFMKLLGLPWLAQVSSRLVILALVLASFGLGRLARRRFPRSLPRTALLGVLLVACARSAEEVGSFSPAEPDSDAGVVERFTNTEKPPTRVPDHVVLPSASRTRAVCTSCHLNKVTGTSLPVTQKGIHEIHFVLQKLELECVICHQEAAAPGFPNLTGNGDRRDTYNRMCVACHLKPVEGKGAELRWEKTYR